MTATLALNGIDFSRLPSGTQASSSRMAIADLNWSNPERSVLEALPRVDILVGSDVFFDSKCT